MVAKYKVPYLCGSTRSREQIIEVQKQLTFDGDIVISIGLNGHAGDDEVWLDGVKSMLEMHRRKNEMADSICVINPEGYFCESSQGEIEYARYEGLGIMYLENKSTYGNYCSS